MKFVFMIAALAAFAASVEAKEETTLRAEDHGVLGAMYRVHCRPQWLSVVLRESNILESQLTTLQLGTPIVLPDGCQTGVPTREDVRMTSQIFATSHRLHEVTNVEHKAEVLQLTLDQVTKERDGLFVRNQILTGELSAAKKIAEYEKSCETERWLLSGIVGSLIASFGWFSVLIHHKRRVQESVRVSKTEAADVRTTEPPRMITLELPAASANRPAAIPDDVPSRAHPYEPKLVFSIMFHGKRVDFADTSTRFAGCPMCQEKRLTPNAENLRQHLEKVHIHLRLEQRPADELRELIATAQRQRQQQDQQ